MTNKYASEDLYTSFNIREPQERSDLYHKYGLTDNTTQSMPAYYCSNDNSWGQETGTILFDSVTGKYFRADRFVDSSNASRWFTLDQLSQTDAKLSPSNTSVEVYSNTCELFKTFSYTDPTDNVTKYLVDDSNLHWRTASEMNNDGFFFEESYAPLYIRSTGTTYVTLESVGTVSGSFEFSYDGVDFSPYTLGTEKQVNDGKRIFFRGTRSTVQNHNNYLHFTITGTGTAAAYGNTNSLTYKDNYVSTTFTQQDYSYYKLFFNCDKLTRAPLLPYTRLSTHCYESMFDGCSSLTTPPQLPATALADCCYLAMFSECRSLVRSPDLPATTPVYSCYNSMFNGCTSLNEIHCKLHYNNLCDDYLTENWIYDVAANGDFYCDILDGWPTNNEDFYMGVPIGWAVHVEQPLCFKNINTGDSTIILKNTVTSSGTALTTDYEYSKSSDYESAVWLPYTVGEQITLQQNESVYFRGSRSTQSSGSYMQFELSGKLNASGNTYSLLDKTNFANVTSLTSYGTCAFYKLFENCQSLYKCPDLPATTLELNCYYRAFYGCTNIEKIPSLLSTEIPADAYGYMFYGCTSIDYLDAYILPATTVQPWGCEYMFCNCTNLITSPKLAGLTLYGYAYASMFRGCTSLHYMPNLPATTLSNYCYSYMFYNCTSLTAEPELPAAELVSSCYAYMFYNCHNIRKMLCKAESIASSATNCTAYWLYGTASSGEFYYYNEDIWTRYSASGIPDGWSDYLAKPLCFENLGTNEEYIVLTQQGNLNPVYYISRDDNLWEPYTIGNRVYLNSTLGNKVFFKGHKDAESSYTGHRVMFNSSTSNTTNIKASGNVNSMLSENFSKITDLTSYGISCLQQLFDGCDISSAPVLPATTLSTYCYSGMFSGCSKLTKGPVLPAKTINSTNYRNMFMYCTSLNEIHCDAVFGLISSIIWNDSADYPLQSTGRLYCADLNVWPDSGTSAVPQNWGIYVEQPVCFENRSEYNYGSIALNNIVESGGTALDSKLYEYAVAPTTKSYRKLKWQQYTFTGNNGFNIPVDPQTAVYFRGSRSSQSDTSYLQFDLNLPSIHASGNINSLLEPTEFSTVTNISSYGTWTFYKMFSNSSLIKPPSLPALQLSSQHCYRSMFYHCSGLTSAPKLPATAKWTCYYHMFESCGSLTAMPKLNSTSLEDYCYAGMFYDCPFLTTVYDLPATYLPQRCYMDMFRDCVRLTSTPKLPATNLAAVECCANMFYGCTSLSTVISFAESITNSATSDWLYNVAQTGTFNCIDSSIWAANSPSGIPQGWTTRTIDTQPLSFRFYNTASGSNSMTISLNAIGTYTDYHLQSSIDGTNWSSYTVNTPITVYGLDRVYFKGDRGAGPRDPSANYLQFEISTSGQVGVYGNLASILSSATYKYSYDVNLEDYGEYVFKNLFKDCEKINSIYELKVPSKLSAGCFYGMFEGCIQIGSSFKLPSTLLKPSCYNSMFKDCIYMHSAPDLPASSIVSRCYDDMFNGCISLNYLRCDINTVTNVSTFSYTPVSINNWLNNVSSNGEFYCTHPIIFTKDSANGIPAGWTPFCRFGGVTLLGEGYHSPRTTYWHMSNCDTSSDTQMYVKIYNPSYFSAELIELQSNNYGIWHWADDGSEVLSYVKLLRDNDAYSTSSDEYEVRITKDSNNNKPILEAQDDNDEIDRDVGTGYNFKYAIGTFGAETDFYKHYMQFNPDTYELSYSGNNTKIEWQQSDLFYPLYNNTWFSVSEEYSGYFSDNTQGDIIHLAANDINRSIALCESPSGTTIPNQNNNNSQYTYTVTGLYDPYGRRISANKYSNTLSVVELNGNLVLRTTAARSEALEIYNVTFTRTLAS